MDAATARKIRKGDIALEGTLDLHGLTEAEAHRALVRFIRAAVSVGKRNLLVITGKGKVGGGVLRRQLPLWLEQGDIASAVLSLQQAQPKDGGTGAFYLRLRRPRG